MYMYVLGGLFCLLVHVFMNHLRNAKNAKKC